MRSVKILILGFVFAAAARGSYPQATGAAQQVRKTADDAAKAAAQTPKPANQPANAAKPATPANSAATKPAAQTPAKSSSPAANVAQSKTAPSVASKPSPQASAPAKPASSPAAKPPASAQATAPAKPAAKPSSRSAKPAKKRTKSAANKPAEKKALGAPSGNMPGPALPIIAKRDPFESMVGREAGQSHATGPMPPGPRGLVVGTLRLDGVVRAPSGMIAVVSNPQQRTYFLREGDQLYDGRVEKISMEGVSFHEVGKDAFGKPVEREVSKRIYASAGEQQ